MCTVPRYLPATGGSRSGFDGSYSWICRVYALARDICWGAWGTGEAPVRARRVSPVVSVESIVNVVWLLGCLVEM